jgi:hypothetical protein
VHNKLSCNVPYFVIFTLSNASDFCHQRKGQSHEGVNELIIVKECAVLTSQTNTRIMQ